MCKVRLIPFAPKASELKTLQAQLLNLLKFMVASIIAKKWTAIENFISSLPNESLPLS